MKKDNKKKKIITIVVSIIIILILVLAISYAFFSNQLNGSDNIVKVGELELVLNETSEGISLDNAIGISDEEGLSLTPSTFELRNNGKRSVDYTIYLDDNKISSSDTRIDDMYLKYNLNKNGSDTGATRLTTTGSNPNRVLDTGTIEGGETNAYSLNLWITDEVDGNYSGHVFSGKLRVEVSQERAKEVSTVLLENIPKENLYDDGEDTFITGEDPNNYIWYSGKLWRAVSINNEEKTVKLVTQWNISAISYDDNSPDFEGSYMQQWLNDTSADGFLGNLREPTKFIAMGSKWNATMMSDTSKPTSTTIIENSVGLLNIYEYTMSHIGTDIANGYLNNGLYWWCINSYDLNNVWYVDNTGNLGYYEVLRNRGIRPSINLKSDVKIVDGNGTEENPYRLEGDNDTNLSGTLLSSRYSGEYISFGSGENNLYRIVSHETEGLTKITSAAPLKNSNSFTTSSFGENITYSDNNIIGSFLNNDYLTISNGYLTMENLNMIDRNTIWYLGTINVGSNYILSKYIDISMSNTAVSSSASVGLLRYGELMSGQFSNYMNNTSYWTLTAYSSFHGWTVTASGNIGSNSVLNKYAVKPAMNLKSNVIITSGDGTKENPFQIELD